MSVSKSVRLIAISGYYGPFRALHETSLPTRATLGDLIQYCSASSPSRWVQSTFKRIILSVSFSYLQLRRMSPKYKFNCWASNSVISKLRQRRSHSVAMLYAVMGEKINSGQVNIEDF